MIMLPAAHMGGLKHCCSNAHKALAEQVSLLLHMGPVAQLCANGAESTATQVSSACSFVSALDEKPLIDLCALLQGRAACLLAVSGLLADLITQMRCCCASVGQHCLTLLQAGASYLAELIC